MTTVSVFYEAGRAQKPYIRPICGFSDGGPSGLHARDGGREIQDGRMPEPQERPRR
jgi:hypothetical protein